MDQLHPPAVEDVPSTSPELRIGKAPPSRPRRRWLRLLIIAVLAAGLYLVWSRNRAPAPASSTSAAAGGRPRGAGITPVVAVKATKGDIGVYVTGLGGVTPLHTVTVASQISGYLMKVDYKEGDMVQQGALLAEIDPRPYQVQLEQAEGQLVKDQANLDNAKVDLVRYQTLVPQNAVPEQTLATQVATVKQDEGIVKTDQGMIDSAKLNLTYCRIIAPITGRVGLRLVDPGNYVQSEGSNVSTASALVVITQLQPITVIVPITEDQLPAVFQKWRAGQSLTVEAYDRGNKTKLASGRLETIDNQIDPTTGTVKLRASFDNRDDALFPNQFVNVRLLVEEKHGVTLVPTAAIQRNSQQTYVWLVKPDSTVTVRQVTLGTVEGDQSEVTSGLNPGDTVVMTGVDRIQEGSKVSVQIEGSNTGKSS